MPATRAARAQSPAGRAHGALLRKSAGGGRTSALQERATPATLNQNRHPCRKLSSR